ncbi:hypothetical protein [Bacteroides clarus]|uniref:hypothetical protein n=1 Tax=Bacteroides clarus TaxID=626929 RepID=UPI002588322C|nr:hypothetical protein [Bacteroides clarus]
MKRKLSRLPLRKTSERRVVLSAFLYSMRCQGAISADRAEASSRRGLSLFLPCNVPLPAVSSGSFPGNPSSAGLSPAPFFFLSVFPGTSTRVVTSSISPSRAVFRYACASNEAKKPLPISLPLTSTGSPMRRSTYRRAASYISA